MVNDKELAKRIIAENPKYVSGDDATRRVEFAAQLVIDRMDDDQREMPDDWPTKAQVQQRLAEYGVRSTSPSNPEVMARQAKRMR